MTEPPPPPAPKPPEPPEPARPAGQASDSDSVRLLLAGVVTYGVLVVGLAARFDLPVLDSLFLALLVELLPVLAVVQVPLARHEPVERMSAYKGSAVTLLVLGSLGLLLGLRGPELQGLGLSPLPARDDLLAWTAAVLLAVAGLAGAFHLLGKLLHLDETSLLVQLIPRTAREKLAFTGLSVVAGFAEEVAFRGYAIPVLAPHVGGAWTAAVLTCLAFGVLHAYQGAVGVVRTALLGMLLATSFLL